MQKLERELTLSQPDVGALNVPSVYICQGVAVCLDCSFSEPIVPPGELQSLKTTTRDESSIWQEPIGLIDSHTRRKH